MTPRARALLVGWLAACLAGCTVTARSAGVDEGPNNDCSADSDCPKGSSCLDDVCQTLNGKLESLLIEVTPGSDSQLPHIPFFAHQAMLPASGNDFELRLTRSSRLQGRLRPPVVSGCERTFYGLQGSELSPSTDGESMPVLVTLRPREAVLGISAQTYLADATLPTVNQNGGIDYTFDLHVPAGTYDVYIQPVEQTIAPAVDGAVIDESCRIPPQLFRGAPLVAEQGVILLTYDPHPSTQIEITVVFPDAPVLDGWVVDIIEPLSGLAISNERALGEPVIVSPPKAEHTLYQYKTYLSYSGLIELKEAEQAVAGTTDLVRLRPPADLVAPTVVLDREGLGLFDPTRVKIEGFTSVPGHVTVQGQMSGAVDGAPAQGRVALVSTEIFGVDPGMFASYQVIEEVGEDGLFEVDLPPGKYNVYAVPASEDPARALSAYRTTWDVPADARFQAGKLLELPSLAEVRGQTGLGTSIRVAASPQRVLPFQEAFGEAAFVPRAFAGLVDDAGRFTVQADPGRFDIAVQPSAASNYAWSVRPSFEVKAGTGGDLGRMPPRVPSVVSGTAVVGGPVVVGGALVRAYAYLNDSLAYTRDPAEARSVIQVAETRTDEEGKFRLFVPDDILPAK